MEPQIIADLPIPLLSGGDASTGGNNSNPVLSDSGGEVPTSNLDQKFPQKVIAVETISQTLNTETKRILAEYEFESLGAFTVQSKTHPLAHISYSGDGIVGVDANGNTTFALDGETGNAVFSGDVRASTFTSDFFNVDTQGNVVANSIKLANTSFVSGSGGYQTFTALSTPVNITGSFLNFTLTQKTIVLFIATADVAIEQNGAGSYGGYFNLYIKSSGEIVAFAKISGGVIGTDSQGAGNVLTSINTHYLHILNPGTYSFNLDVSLDASVGTPKGFIYDFRFSYITLGNA